MESPRGGGPRWAEGAPTRGRGPGRCAAPAPRPSLVVVLRRPPRPVDSIPAAPAVWLYRSGRPLAGAERSGPSWFLSLKVMRMYDGRTASPSAGARGGARCAPRCFARIRVLPTTTWLVGAVMTPLVQKDRVTYRGQTVREWPSRGPNGAAWPPEPLPAHRPHSPQSPPGTPGCWEAPRLPCLLVRAEPAPVHVAGLLFGK